MKILNISSDASDAQAAASALDMLGPRVVISTATRLQDAAHWIFNNLDVAALILDARFGAASCAAFLKHLRTRCLTAPVIIIAAEESVSAIEAFGLGQADRVVTKKTLPRDLGAAVQRAVGTDRAEASHLFDAYPLPLCRSSHDGVITGANSAFAALFGCPSATKKRTLELASELLNGSQELAWLTERCVSTSEASSIECIRRKVDGSRLVLRLSAFATSDAIHIVTEDITSHWLLQDRLARAQRMEAVGRLAAEVALTCANLLGQVNDDGLKWVATLEDPVLRQSGERLLSEMMRAAGFLKQLSEYGDEQASTLDPVDLHEVLHDLEPILQELAGDAVQVVIPEKPPREVPRFNLDLKAERVERLLINVAGYSRARMRSGGKMIFDVSPTLVDRDFVDTHPNVRQGPHVLLTVTEGKVTDAPAGLRKFLERFTQKEDEAATTPEGPVVDFGTLQDLVQECGGHLWVEADPPGDMTIKIHLPLRAA
jgi:DNA-binding NarL/FixJ family response regulator